MNLYGHTVHVFGSVSFSRLRKYKQLALLVFLVFVFSIGTARSYVIDNSGAVFDKATDVSHETLVVSNNKTSPSSADSVCSSLLNTENFANPSKHPAVRNQRSVGKAAAIGLLLGVQNALEPKQQNIAYVKASDSKKGAIGKSFESVVAYRNCLKTEALEKLASK